MTATPADLTDPSSRCVHFLEEARWSVLKRALVAPGQVVLEGSLSEVRSKKELLSVVSTCMEFPDYFGWNWDALHECLRDLSWKEGSGYLLALHSAEIAWKRNPRVLSMLVDIWMSSAKEWARNGTGFHLAFVW